MISTVFNRHASSFAAAVQEVHAGKVATEGEPLSPTAIPSIDPLKIWRDVGREVGGLM